MALNQPLEECKEAPLPSAILDSMSTNRDGHYPDKWPLHTDLLARAVQALHISSKPKVRAEYQHNF